MKADGYFDSRTMEITLSPGATAYTVHHELAHRAQQEELAAVWRIWNAVNWIRVLEYFATLLIEFDAYRRARHAMRVLGIWNADYAKQARRSLFSYVTRQEI